MNILNILLIFITGLILGSFFNVCIYRIPRNEPLLFPPSHCIYCEETLNWRDLIPIISWLTLKAKCRYCNNRISVRYPIIELITSIVYLILYFKFGLSSIFLTYCILCSLLIIITVIDIDHQIIPDELILTGTTAGIILSLIGLSVQISDALIGMLIGGGTYLLIAITAQLILKKEGLGGGDIKLMAMIGLILGWKLTLVSMLLSVYIGGLIGSILLFFKIKNRTDTIPYGPIIAFGTFITMLFGNELLSWYITLL